jgi:undecaprenyl-diphosphatase
MADYIILGIIQGLTEFFPVSSSAHLLIAERLLGIQNNQLGISIILHLGTVAALLIFFWSDIIETMFKPKLILFIVLVTAITGIIAISGKDFFEGLFSEIAPAAAALLATGVILILTAGFAAAKRDNVNLKDGFILGIAQGLAVIPGISRSGITISTLLFRGIKPAVAFRVSLLASIPAVLGAALLEAKEISFALEGNFSGLAVGFFCSLFTGLIALWVLKLILHRAKLYYFGYYCIAVAVVTLIFIK